MTYQELFEEIKKKRSYLCVGLDTDIRKIPTHLLDFEDPVFEFNKQIIEATHDLCVSYKLNIAFYESLGQSGWESLRKTIECIPSTHFTIADAKRGDIGNTSKMYARTFFETYSFDSITVNPYMGRDSVQPFLDFDDKWVILLCLTSNSGSDDFQMVSDNNGQFLYERVFEVSQTWADEHQMMYVVGATHPEQLAQIRQKLPYHFFLIPGVGAQGGNLHSISEAGWNAHCGMLVNSSRGIIYADTGEHFASAARDEAFKLQQQMSLFLDQKQMQNIL
jgi:orotidine-5'-phosphate decarboxylase